MTVICGIELNESVERRLQELRAMFEREVEQKWKVSISDAHSPFVNSNPALNQKVLEIYDSLRDMAVEILVTEGFVADMETINDSDRKLAKLFSDSIQTLEETLKEHQLGGDNEAKNLLRSIAGRAIGNAKEAYNMGTDHNVTIFLKELALQQYGATLRRSSF